MRKYKKHNYWSLGLLFSSLCISVPSFGNSYSSVDMSIEAVQQKDLSVKGIVLDETGEPLIGVSVAVKDTNTGTITDYEGKYVLKIQEGAMLTFSYVGYKTVTIRVTKEVLDVTLHEDMQTMQEVVVVGYGVQKKENLTGAVASVDLAKQMDSRPVSDIGQALQGSVPGLSISSLSGEIGEAPTVKIRGGNVSPNAQNNGQALILLDNVEVPDITMINPDDIESISILKDAGSASIYGARGSNGVILITSKNKKKNERVRISYNGNFSLRTPTTNPKQLSAWQQADINLQGVNSMDGSQSYNVVGQIRVDREAVEKMKEWESLYGGQNLGREMQLGRDFEFRDGSTFFYRPWDWHEMFVKDWSPQQQHNLNLSGGGENLSFNSSLAYMKTEGMTKINTDNFERYNFSTSVVGKINKYIDFRLNSMYVKGVKSSPYIYGSDLYDYLYYLYRWQPIYPYGTYDGREFRSAMTDLRQATTNKRTNEYLRLGGGVTIRPFKDFTIDSDFYYSTNQTSFKKHGTKLYGYNSFNTGGTLESLTASYGDYSNNAYNAIFESNGKSVTYTSNTVATYSKTFKEKHNTKFMVGANFESNEYTFMSINSKSMYDTNLPELSLTYGDITKDSKHTSWAVAGFFGRINYDYDNKYLLEINGRYDGSSKFPRSKQFGYFGSYSAGYRITQEKFMEPVKPFLSDMKIRASYGEIGSQDLANNQFRSLITLNDNYNWMVNGNYSANFNTPTIVNPNLTWEKIATYDIGIDARFLSNKLGVSFDWYRKYTRDVISVGSQLPATLGGDAPKVNFGELVTPGWELSVDYNFQVSNELGFYVEAHISDYYTKVNKWSKDVAAIPTYGSGGNGWSSVDYYRKGMRLGDIWGYKTDGLFQMSDFDENGKLKAGIADHTFEYGTRANTDYFLLGFTKYKDLNGDGVVNNGNGQTDDSGDKTVIGNMFPRYEYGFSLGANFRGFDFKVLFQGIGKRHVWAAGNQVLPGFTTGEPYYKGADDYWTPENTGAFYPRPYIYNQSQSMSYAVNDRYLLNMAYLRAKSITIGYTLPTELVKKAYMNKVRVYFTGENLFEFSKVKPDIDPETGIRMSGTTQDARNFGRTYPYYRTLSFGLQVIF